MEEWHTTGETVTPAGLVKGLGLLDATTLVMGSMIGSGIFIVSADIARQVASPGLLIMTWVVTAVLTIIAALSYGELAAAMPQAGGQYVYLREAFGPLSGFLYGWTLFLVIQTGTIAAVAVAFAKFAGVFFPWISAQNDLLRIGRFGFNTQQLLAIAVLVLLTWVEHARRPHRRDGPEHLHLRQDWRRCSGWSVSGFCSARNPEAVAGQLQPTSGGTPIGASTPSGWWAWPWWARCSPPTPGTTSPSRRARCATRGATCRSRWRWASGSVSRALPRLQFRVPAACCRSRRFSTRPRTAWPPPPLRVIFGPVAVQVMAAAIMISTFGCINGMILAGARVYYAMALDGSSSARWRSSTRAHHTPVVSLARAVRLGLPADADAARYSDLLDYVIFAVLLFYILTIAGLFVLRRTRPDMERPYRALGYPVLPAALHRGRRADRSSAAALQAELHLAGADHRAAGRAGVFRVAAARAAEQRV